MKVKELIESLKDFEDFDLDVSIFVPDGTSWGAGSYGGKLTGIADVGYSDKTIKLDFDDSDIRSLIENLIERINSSEKDDIDKLNESDEERRIDLLKGIIESIKSYTLQELRQVNHQVIRVNKDRNYEKLKLKEATE